MSLPLNYRPARCQRNCRLSYQTGDEFVLPALVSTSPEDTTLGLFIRDDHSATMTAAQMQPPSPLHIEPARQRSAEEIPRDPPKSMSLDRALADAGHGEERPSEGDWLNARRRTINQK